MTEENMKRLYDHFVATGQPGRAEQITNIDRYSKFKETISEEKEEEKPKSKGKK